MANIERIKSLAKEKGLSLSFICSKIGVARIYFNDVQKYNREIPLTRLEIIADLLGTTVEYLNGQTDEKEKPVSNNVLHCDPPWFKKTTPYFAAVSDPQDREFIELYSKLTPEERKIILDLIKNFASNKM